VWVNAAEDQAVVQRAEHLAHPRAEDARAWSEVLGRRLCVGGSVRLVEHSFHGTDLLDESGIAQGPRRLIVHRVVAQLVSAADEVLQHLLVARDLRSDDEEGRGCAVRLEDLHDLLGVLGWPIVDRERNDLRGRRDAPQDVGPSMLEVAYEESGRLVDQVKGRDQDAHETQKNDHCRDPRASSSPVQLRGQSEEVRDTTHGRISGPSFIIHYSSFMLTARARANGGSEQGVSDSVVCLISVRQEIKVLYA